MWHVHHSSGYLKKKKKKKKKKKRYKKLFTHVEVRESAQQRRIALYKSDQ